MEKQINFSKIDKGRLARKDGYAFENMAAVYLFLKGYKIVKRNLKMGRGTNCGEVDIIAVKGNTLVFVEVKSRKTLDLAADAVTLKNKQRVTKSASVFLGTHPEYNGFDIRFDVILKGAGGLPRHIKDAWRPDWW